MTTPAKKTANATPKAKAATKTESKAKSKVSAAVKPARKLKVAIPKLSSIEQALENHLVFSSFKTNEAATPRDWYHAASYTVRDHVVKQWVKTAESYYRDDPKRVYYLSLEFLIGRMLSNAALNLGIEDELKKGITALGRELENTVEMENDAALGNGGLGRLAACFLDSMATMDIPATGYGIRYEYGMFKQSIEGGQQVENPDNWLRYGNVWEFQRPESTYDIKFYGHVVEGEGKQHWVNTEHVVAMAYDMPVPGYGGKTVNSLRLWSAKAAREFDLKHFNDGNFEQAVQERNDTESISKVLYPNDASVLGKVLRLKQQYFFVSASIQDILRRFLSTHEMKKQADWAILPDKIAIQLNDTHPSIGVAEMMYQLVDVHRLEWDFAWKLVVKIFAYTNHTLMPEALETWTVDLFGRLLPRHLEIIYKINFEFLHMVNHHFPGDPELLQRVSIIDESNGRRVRMAHLAVVGSHTVNGVAALHSQLLKQHLFADFDRIYPGKLTNVTNGITPRRWLNQANPGLTALLEKAIGADFKKDLTLIKKITPLANDANFRKAFAAVKHANKARLAAKIEQKTGIKLNVNSLFDVQIKRIHEYKRQLLNVLHIITLYNRIRSGEKGITPRTVIFGGKAAPGYWMAKQIIRLINDVASIVNEDLAVGDQLKVVYYPNYEVSAAEILFPGSDLSEQISTAGTEASGTGNMKMSLNGALTIGTLDGANVEIMEEVGEENIFIFGLTTPQVAEVKANGYNPNDYYHNNPELKQVLDMIANGFFSVEEPNRYQPIIDNLLKNGDQYLLLADYASYIETQDRVGKLYQNQDEWTRLVILNVANMAKFSSDRAISDYAKNIWHVKS
ncbi:glycogen/starch/alpha-glucan phosphorylase [Methylotenera sp.]|uniref:glycogen/starch/alpha-glucan phosphorylase n=1 Tax=Methylotenera sp. TaxID=2051956 RepID=UPI00248740E6|nr:glycogen/starch/alpha-glucan phosphorylase [Methylotenera sp.]MDI1298157.1 glycogen/starch/alpha-glucan phosphorylase [Methylotenera sp.]